MSFPPLPHNTFAPPRRQVPLIGWASRAPLVGPWLHGVLGSIAPGFSRASFDRSGEQFFLADRAAAGDPPLLARMAHDDEGFPAPFFSALAAFETRTAYANVAGDHLVAWANASLRSLDELPELQVPRGAVGVIREDGLDTAWSASPPPPGVLREEWDRAAGQTLPIPPTEPAPPAASGAWSWRLGGHTSWWRWVGTGGGGSLVESVATPDGTAHDRQLSEAVARQLSDPDSRAAHAIAQSALAWWSGPGEGAGGRTGSACWGGVFARRSRSCSRGFSLPEIARLARPSLLDDGRPILSLLSLIHI